MSAEKRATRRTVAFVAAVLLWTAFIWIHSTVPGYASTAESDAVVSRLEQFFIWLGVSDPLTMTLIVRKAAHVSEYALLGFLVCGVVLSLAGRERRRVVLAGVYLVAVPSIDECIQLFVPGRSGMFTDVLIDLCGIAIGVLVSRLVFRKVAADGSD